MRLLRRRAQIAARFVGGDTQGTEDIVDVGRFDRAPIVAANARVDDIHPTDTPARPALFDREALARANRELHRRQIPIVEKIAPPATFSRHLVHVGEIRAQIAVSGLDGTVSVLMTNDADIIRIENHDIGFDCQRSEVGHDQIVGNSAIRVRTIGYQSRPRFLW